MDSANERDVVAERQLDQPTDEGMERHRVAFERPLKRDGLWVCRYTAGAIVEEGFGYGLDSLQALHAAMKDAAWRAREWNADNGGELEWCQQLASWDLFPDQLGIWYEPFSTDDGHQSWRPLQYAADEPRASSPGGLSFFASMTISSDEVIRWSRRAAVRRCLGEIKFEGPVIDDRIWSALERCPHLENITLWGSMPLVTGRGIGRLRGLRDLSLSGCPNTEEGRMEIAQLPHLQCMWTIDVPWSDEALEAIGLSKTVLQLSWWGGCAYTDRGLQALGRSTSLQEVWLDPNPGVTLAGLEAVMRAPRLDVVCLSKRFDVETVEACRALRPDITVKHIGRVG